MEVSWAPGKKGNAPLPPAAVLRNQAAIHARKRKQVDGPAAVPAAQPAAGTVRVWAYGREEVRQKVRVQVADFDEAVGTDVFVA